jgi:hypothetical protein
MCWCDNARGERMLAVSANLSWTLEPGVVVGQAVIGGA